MASKAKKGRKMRHKQESKVESKHYKREASSVFKAKEVPEVPLAVRAGTAPPPVVAPEPKPEPKPVGPKLDDATLDECALLAESYVSRHSTQHTPRDLLAYEIAAAIRSKKGAKA